MAVASRAQGLGQEVVDLSWLSDARIFVTPWTGNAALKLKLHVAAGVAVCYALCVTGWVRAARVRGVSAEWCAGVALVLLPVVLAVSAPGAKYAFYKLGLTVAPLDVLGACLAVRGRWRIGERPEVRSVVVAAVVGVSVVATVHQQAFAKPFMIDRNVVASWNDPELARVIDRVNAEPTTDVRLVLGDEQFAWVSSGAVLYHARRHRIQLESPQQLWLYPQRAFPALRVAEDNPLRPGTLIVTNVDAAVSGEVLLRTDRYLVVRAAGTDPDRYARAGR